MAFKFAWLCELLDQLDQNRLMRSTTPTRAANTDHRIIISWFNKHSRHITRQGEDAVALLSSFFPEHRSDRVYNLQETRLAAIFGRALRLPAKRVARLNRWKERDGADFATCVEEVMREAEFDVPSPARAVTIEEIHRALDQLAANSTYSSPKLQSMANNKTADELLRRILWRLQSSEAKWLVRMLLKSFSPVQIPEYSAMHEFHFLLPDILAVQNTFEAAVAVLSKPELSSIPPRQDLDAAKAFRIIASDKITPQLGVMIKRQPYDKARSIKHCCQMADNKMMSVERKYDGEYCQIHIDVEAKEKIQIFSKSGKDSTLDRINLHRAIEDALQVRSKECQIKRACILEGELLVWNRSQRSIQEFSKIRAHVKHGGRSLGTKADLPASYDEHLMIVFYDLLLLDEDVCLHKAQKERRLMLQKLVKTVKGVTEVGEQEVIDFRSRKASEQLRTAFASAITERWEGFVLKGRDDPYFSFNGRGRGIKLKKDYIKGLGDTADLAVVGGSRDPVVEQELDIGKLLWTSFDLACIDNKEEVRRFKAKPIYRLVGSVTHHCISKENIKLLNRIGQFYETSSDLSEHELEVMIDAGMSRPQSFFRKPFVADTYGAGFVKPSDMAYYFLRFARVEKIHDDRGVEDVIGFNELQDLAKQSVNVPEFEDSQENRDWVARLLDADRKKAHLNEKSQNTTPERSNDSMSTASPSPLISRKRKSAVSIRIDTGEISPSEKLVRISEKAGYAPATVTSGGTVINVLSAEDYSQAVSAAKSGKLALPSVSTLLPQSTMPRSSSRKANTILLPRSDQISTPHSVYTGGKLSRLTRTPPWCIPSSRKVKTSAMTPGPSTAFSALISSATKRSRLTDPGYPSPNSGEPLAEITNNSARTPAHSAMSVKDAPKPTAVGKGNPKLGPARTCSRELQVAAKAIIRNRVTMPPLSGILTPPASSADELDEQISENTSRKRKWELLAVRIGTPVASSSEDPKNLSRKRMWERRPGSTKTSIASLDYNSKTQPTAGRADADTDVETCSPKVKPLPGRTCQTLVQSGPLLLSSSFRNSSSTKPPAFDSLLEQAEAGFTYSKKYFVRQILSSTSTPDCPTSAIVLVDWKQPESVATETKILAQDLWEAMESTPSPTLRYGKVLVLHWKCLQGLKYGQLSLALARRHFAGCLDWSGGAGTAGSGGMKIDVVWDRERAISG